MGVQVPVALWKRAPSPTAENPLPENPPHTRSSVPVHTPACAHRALGGGAVPCQLHVVGDSRATDVAVASFAAAPPQIRISSPVHTATWPLRAVGAPVVGSAAQVSPLGVTR